MRMALGVSYQGRAYAGWQSQPTVPTVQDALEKALARFVDSPIVTLCAGRTDAGVHGLMQVVHFDTHADRPDFSWVRGVNTFLPSDIAVQWARHVPQSFHSRACALRRRYVYVVLQSPVRPSLEAGAVGWVFRKLDHEAMNKAAQLLVGEHDFSSFRASACQALTPVKTLYHVHIHRRPGRPIDDGSADTRHSFEPCYWRFEFEGNAFLHHMIRNIMGCLLMIGQGLKPPEWMAQVLEARSRDAAAPTFSPDGLYFAGPVYGPQWGLPERTPAYDWLP
ncbi:MAG: tRNA pseudouridine(38-40) synthase TruA [Curvibacter lanceolatus]|uniref:tRNA pseudouridine(38-40) synthase TruA n=1 Tax=Curvibacter lanceolatus TaxID=86182 RepID=UPI00036F5EDA|nr:tRNA pseudouridine(38-40) synthase TruA [Curvibacter lanceolatus]MBV5293202.1 tRNA pseudouridine(38-40) synthase TruA [Curvibacter lanceolatus]